ncbi:serine hydrolase domain-containing protein [Flavilitoribacter nigricans]|nr:serine hydrolase domain-containing protein [Flavilitoribacter nigricans]
MIKIYKTLFSLLLLSLTVLPIERPLAQTSAVSISEPILLSPTAPENVGISAPRLNRINTLLEQAVADQYLPGAVVMIGRKGQIPYLETFGYRDVAAKDPMAADDIFRMASMTKPVVSVGIMMLYEEGKFLLDDPIAKFVPAFAEMEVLDEWNEADGSYTTKAATQAITFRQLLSHTSGIGYPFIHPALGAIAREKGLIQGYSTLDVSLEENMKVLSEMPLVHEPGARWTYGLSTDLLGYLIEVISGQALDEYLAERIFEPLGMKDTHFYMSESKADRLAGLYFHNDAAQVQVNPDPNGKFPYTGARRYFSGGAGLVSTATDYAAFLQMLLNKGDYNGHILLGKKTVELMTMDHLHGTPGGPEAFGLGFAITTERGAAQKLGSPGNYRWAGIFGTDFWVDPQEELFGIIMTQVLPFQNKDAFFARIQNAIYQSIID